MTNKIQNIDLTIPRRRYYNDNYNLTTCPECGSDLKEEDCSILLYVKSDSDEGEFMTNLSGSHFCYKCPVVVFDTNKIKQAATFGIRSGKNLRYGVAGIINFASIPDDKKHLPIGSDKNPVPLVQFLPDLKDRKLTTRKPGRNDSCLCGSGVKYKKCFGR